MYNVRLDNEICNKALKWGRKIFERAPLSVKKRFKSKIEYAKWNELLYGKTNTSIIKAMEL